MKSYKEWWIVHDSEYPAVFNTKSEAESYAKQAEEKCQTGINIDHVISVKALEELKAEIERVKKHGAAK